MKSAVEASAMNTSLLDLLYTVTIVLSNSKYIKSHSLLRGNLGGTGFILCVHEGGGGGSVKLGTTVFS
jgi:hypothetical protein